jgi:hypothetical protein
MGWGARFAGVVVVGALLSACGGAGPEGQVLPAVSPETSAEPSPGPSDASSPASANPSPEATGGADLPPAASQHSAKGAEAFVRHWIAVANDAFAHGEVEQWRELGLSTCKSCDKRIAAVEKTYKSGGRIEGGQLAIGDVAATPVRNNERTLVLAKVTASRETHIDVSGRSVSDHPGSPLRFVFYLDWRDSAWKVAEIQLGVDK